MVFRFLHLLLFQLFQLLWLQLLHKLLLLEPILLKLMFLKPLMLLILLLRLHRKHPSLAIPVAWRVLSGPFSSLFLAD